MKSIEKYETHIWNTLQIHYRKSGNGPKHLLIFHGFGQTHDVFDVWTHHLKTEYTCYLFDLPFHGHSRAPAKILHPQQWLSFISSFTNSLNIERYSLAGFSLGGRFALSLFIENEEKIEEMWLIAPDGIFESFWYKLSTGKFFKPVFRYFMFHPSAFHGLLYTFEKTRIVKGPMIRFARKELQSRTNRVRVYKSWVYFKSLKYPKSFLKKRLQNSKVSIKWFISKSDSIIPWQAIAPLIPNNTNSTIIWLTGKHHELIQEALKHIP